MLGKNGTANYIYKHEWKHPSAGPLSGPRRAPAVTDIQPEPLCIEIDLVVRFLEGGSDVLRVLELAQIDIGPGFLDRVTDQLCGPRFSLGAHDGRLFLLAGFVDYEGCALGFLLCDLFGFYCCCELWGEGQVLWGEIKLAFCVACCRGW